MAEQRLPYVNSDDGIWGDILRQYLMKEHTNDDTDNPLNGGHKHITIIGSDGTAGTAPITFTSGTKLSAAADGAMEYDGTYYYLTSKPSGSAIRKRIAVFDETGGATGDIYYRDANGYLTKLAAGSTGDLLTISSGTPSWTSGVSGSNITDLDDSVAALMTGDYGGSPTAVDTGILNLFSIIWSLVAPIDDDETLTDESVDKAPSQRATKVYVDNSIADTTALKPIIQSTNYAASAGELVYATESLTVTLPASPADGDTVGVALVADVSNPDFNAIVEIEDSSNTTIMTISTGEEAVFVYTDSKWLVYDGGLATIMSLAYGFYSTLGLIPLTALSNQVAGISAVQTITNKDLTSGTNTFPTFNQSTTGNAATATKLQNSRTVQTDLASASSASFDGSANITPGVTGVLPIANGGTGNTTGAVASADSLTTARNIRTNLATTSSATFDGSADVNPGVTGILPTANGGTGNSSGSVASLTTARNFQTNLASTSAASFNGTANVTPGVTGTLPVANGGTGATTLTGLVKGNGTSAMTAVTAPSGAIVGTTDTQTLTGKTISLANNTLTGAVTGSTNGTMTSKTLWTGTQAQYNAIGTKDSNTVYIVTS